MITKERRIELKSIKLLKKPESIRIAYFPIKFEIAVSLAKPLRAFAPVLLSMRRDFNKDLEEADMHVDVVDYASVAVLCGLFYLILFLVGFGSFAMNPEIEILFPESSDTLISVLLASPFAVAIIMMIQVMNIPSMTARKKAKGVEKNLLYALRHMTVQVRSGASLFEAMKSVAFSEYGKLSSDMDITIKQVASGFSTASAIDSLAMRNRSKSYKKILWQLENAIRTGSDVGEVLMAMSENYFEEQKIAIQKFGRDMNTITMIFLIVTVIFPVMSVIVLVMTALIPVQSIPSSFLFVLLFVVGFVQFMIIGYIKEKRPPVYF
ncbi:MAG: type II secretion system F family protein [Candidatus Micrarchaeota archaeon]